MLTGKRRTDRVLRAIEELLASEAGPEGLLPQDINLLLREQNEPMGAWEVRGELSNLERQGLMRVDPATGRWFAAALRKSA